MNSPRQTGRVYRRAGVTLTELVVVISVIAVLVGLTFTMFEVAHQATHRLQVQVASVNARAGKPPIRSPERPVPIANQYVVTFKNSVTNPLAEANRLGQALPANVLNVYATAIKGCSVRIQPGDLAALQADPAVAHVDQVYRRYLCVTPTGVRRIQYAHAPRTPPFQLFFPGGTGSNGTTIGNNGPRNLTPGMNTGGPAAAPPKAVVIMDSGIDSTHPDLNVVLSKSFVAGIPNGEDQFGHGTHCAGIVGAKGIGVVGVFPGVPLWSLRVFGNIPAGQTEPTAADTDIIAALDFMALNANQVSVCNMSLGGKGADTALTNAVTNCADLGVVMCVAAGNSSADAIDFIPANASQAICVAALCDTDGLPGAKGPAGSFGDGDDTFASFSNFGPVVALIAPGEDIFSTIPVALGSYGVKSGTSMATPTVAGLAALVISNFGGTPGSSGNDARNLPPGLGGGSQFVISNPAQVLGFLQQESVEMVQGLKANKDKRSYPLITGRP